MGASAPSKEHVLSMLGSALKLSSSPQRKIQVCKKTASLARIHLHTLSDHTGSMVLARGYLPSGLVCAEAGLSIRYVLAGCI